MARIGGQEISSCGTYWGDRRSLAVARMGGQERCIQGFGGETCWKETSLKT